jgi:hypothetical protein
VFRRFDLAALARSHTLTFGLFVCLMLSFRWARAYHSNTQPISMAAYCHHHGLCYTHTSRDFALYQYRTVRRVQQSSARTRPNKQAHLLRQHVVNRTSRPASYAWKWLNPLGQTKHSILSPMSHPFNYVNMCSASVPLLTTALPCPSPFSTL